jgi:hypothetical protein
VMSKHIRAAWTIGNEDEIQRLAAGGESYSRIAYRFGTTRNAVSGYVNRHGWAAPKERPPIPRPAPQPSTRIVTFKPKPKLPPVPPVHLPKPAQAPVSRNRTILELRKGECHYPTGGTGADMQFCGNPASGRYCPFHANIAFAPRRS